MSNNKSEADRRADELLENPATNGQTADFKREQERLAEIDSFICEVLTHKSHRIHPRWTKYLREIILPIIRARTNIPDYLIIYAVKQTRGRAFLKERRITVPTWACEKNITQPGYVTWYLAHEIAHIAQYAEDGYCDNHGQRFMKHLKRICPENCIDFELEYKPRNASKAGIGNYEDL
jgi:hypothetical protein